ncbi:MAG: Do family serine endopeptidase [Prevotellaceae bacterium]|jgi:Do/DeqQ family serine protease|nr:Do family serine endopeptidase [Prevotellaceae bacterium]
MKKILFIAAVVSVLAGVSASVITSKLINNKTESIKYVNTPAPKVQWANLSATGQPVDFTYAAEQTIHAVVHVKIVYKNLENRQQQRGGRSLLDFFFFGDPFERNDYDDGYGIRPDQLQRPPRESHGSGSGVIISPDGYIVTNNHVIEKANEVEVTLNNKQTYIAKVIGSDPSTDVALLKVDATDLPYLPFGNSDDVKIGEWVLAVGNPFNLTSTVTAGIVSAKARSLGAISNSNKMNIQSFIQTDAAVNMGNSGGALVNTRGELIGINSAIASTTGMFAGYSFAVPSQIAKKVVDDLKEYGVVQRAMLGVLMTDLTPETAKQNNISTKEFKGAIINEVTSGSAAEIAGMQKNDIITHVNDVEVNSGSDIQEQIARYKPNDKIKITVIRNEKVKHFDVTLRNKNGSIGFVKSHDELFNSLGATLEELDITDLRRYMLRNGIQVKKLTRDGKFKAKGIREGFIIEKVNHKRVSSIEELKEILSNTVDGVALFEGIYPNGERDYYAIGID